MSFNRPRRSEAATIGGGVTLGAIDDVGDCGREAGAIGATVVVRGGVAFLVTVVDDGKVVATAKALVQQQSKSKMG
jgi:galactokinase/mevalonate kinase-like predicted kinase